MKASVLVFLFTAACGAFLPSAAGQSFTNPVFPGADPWVTYQDGQYYYSGSECDGHPSICVKVSSTLLGLAKAPWKVVWKPRDASNPNGSDLWAPEIHKVNGHWFIYYAADPNGNNNAHRIFVLRADSENPLGSYSEGRTDGPHGGLPAVNTHWGIDPDVFSAADRRLYLTWSCTNYADSRFPQRVCLARMKDAEHVDSTFVPISTPTEPWEIRGAAIQEGPVGYTRNGRTYITYSGSSSWIPNDYAVGELENKSSDLLNAANWVKTGPIFDHHGTTYGPGSVVFIRSAEDGEYWNVYHAIERLDCHPAYTCRDVRMQPMTFSAAGVPLLGYPFNVGVPIADRPAATELNAEWGAAWGDAAEGLQTGKVAGKWSWSGDELTLEEPQSGWNQTFRRQNPNLTEFTAHAEVKLSHIGASGAQYGMYCLYNDANNHAEVVIDNKTHALRTHAVVAGREGEWMQTKLPESFKLEGFHRLRCTKNGDSFTFQVDALPSITRQFHLGSGQMGVLAQGASVTYRNAGIETMPNHSSGVLTTKSGGL